MAYRKSIVGVSRRQLRAEFLQTLGAPRSADAMQMALLTMLEAFDKTMATLPPGSVARSMVAGAFGKAPEISRKVLEIV